MTLIAGQEETTARYPAGRSPVPPRAAILTERPRPPSASCPLNDFTTRNSRVVARRFIPEKRADKASDAPYYTEQRRFHDATTLFAKRCLRAGVYARRLYRRCVYLDDTIVCTTREALFPTQTRHSCCSPELIGDVHRPRWISMFIHPVYAFAEAGRCATDLRNYQRDFDDHLV